ncbi:MAG: hypothetical protein JO196_13375 [Hyphomicrobiales bacterium]|nr:hypothetical protein [Hyphomicrobiales bacterium]
MITPSAAFVEVVANMRRILAEEAAATGDADLALFLRPLEHLTKEANASFSPDKGAKLPVCRYLAGALDAAPSGKARELATGLRRLEPFLNFVQNPNYRRAPPTGSFLTDYGYAVLAGPDDGAPALVSAPSIAFGILLLGPHTEYPAHHHPAAELYVPLGPADWAKGSAARSADASAADWVRREPGCVIHHRPNVVHATRTHETPLAALYLWAGDLATYARLAD